MTKNNILITVGIIGFVAMLMVGAFSIPKNTYWLYGTLYCEDDMGDLPVGRITKPGPFSEFNYTESGLWVKHVDEDEVTFYSTGYSCRVDNFRWVIVRTKSIWYDNDNRDKSKKL